MPFLRQNPQTWLRERVPDEIDWELDAQEELIGQVRPYVEELSDVAVDPPESPGEFVWKGGPFSGFDACAYYGLVRHLRPRRVIEVGLGWSTLILRRALDTNGEPAEVTLIDPYPDRNLIGDLRPGWRIVEGMIQHVDLAHFDTLRAGDVLFYDGSHCVRTGSDVNWMLFEVIPRLATAYGSTFTTSSGPRLPCRAVLRRRAQLERAIPAAGVPDAQRRLAREAGGLAAAVGS